jgi:two-component system, chemotaxis family, protein-glutamate methylesterase/glutaminase
MSPHEVEAIVIGGSAGALDALRTILPALSPPFALPIAIVLHLLPTRPSGLTGILANQCSLRVKEAEDKEPIAPATLYLASPNYHLLVERRRCFSLSTDEPIHFSRPSIDVLFETAADAYGPGLVGVLLTGANEDGARGLERIKAAGGITIVQSPDTAVVRTMPDAALRLSRVDHILSLAEIGPFLSSLGSRLPLETP